VSALSNGKNDAVALFGSRLRLVIMGLITAIGMIMGSLASETLRECLSLFESVVHAMRRGENYKPQQRNRGIQTQAAGKERSLSP